MDWKRLTLAIPPTPGRSIVKRLGRETDQWSLGQVLGDKGYHPYFIYGGRSYFENMGSFFQGNGYAIIDQSSVPSEQVHYTNAWGMADEDLYQQAITTADAEYANQQPFFLHLMTTSNHRPYTYPDGRIDIPSGSGRSGAVKYSDYAIGQFLQQAQEKPWFRDTLFVFVADHQAGSAGKTTLPLERYHIPLWIYAPAHIKAQVNNTLASQVDVAPTLLGLLNMSYRSCFFGRDILKSPARRALIANYQYLGLYDGKEMAILEPQKVARLQKFDNGVQSNEESALRADSFLKRDISYYQGAAYVYRHRLNAWSLRNNLAVSGALHAANCRGNKIGMSGYKVNLDRLEMSSQRLIFCASLFLVIFYNATFFSAVEKAYPLNFINGLRLFSVAIVFVFFLQLLFSLFNNRYLLKPVLIGAVMGRRRNQVFSRDL